MGLFFYLKGFNVITNQKDLRRQFWGDNPRLSKIRITNYTGNGKMYHIDTYCTFVDYVDMLARNGTISEKLAFRATLD